MQADQSLKLVATVKGLQRLLQPRPMLTPANQEWAIDFAGDFAAGGQRLRRGRQLQASVSG